MELKSIKKESSTSTNSAIEFVQWPVQVKGKEKHFEEKVLAIQTTRIAPNDTLVDLNSPYQGFNLGLHVGDSETEVKLNRQYLQRLLPEKVEIQWFEQVHGSEVADVLNVSETAIVADAAITRSRNVALAIMTADCLPILLVSKSGDEIAAIHGGWRPLAADVITKTINKMKTPNSDVFAWLGPCISKDAFEVGSEVKAAFVEQSNVFIDAFIKNANGKYLADLQKIARLQLEKLGITHISILPECTLSKPNKYYSYRKNAITGRMASLICIL
jgi:YfiH family protein